MSRVWPVLLLGLASGAGPAEAREPELRGSPESMVRQNEVARENDYTFLRTPSQVREFVEEGRLVPIDGNADYRVSSGVDYPFARPELRTFLERLAAQYRAGCGEQLVVTSLTRPLSRQPGNAHPLSVHPAGMAVDLRVSQEPGCRQWLEATLLSLEGNDLIDVTRERRPPHYHIAVFADAYMAHVARLEVAEQTVPAATVAAGPTVSGSGRADRPQRPASDDRTRFGLAVLLSLALMFALSRGQKRGWDRPI